MAEKKEQKIELGFTRLEYGDPARPQRAVLELSTDKHYDGGLVSRASVYWHSDHSRSQLIALGGSGGDYSHRPSRTDRSVRATQKAIDKLHADVFTPDVIQMLTAEAKAHYAAVVEAGNDDMRNTYLKPEAATHVTTQNN